MPDTVINFNVALLAATGYSVHLIPVAGAAGAAAINTGAEALRISFKASLSNHVLHYIDCAYRGAPPDTIRLTAIPAPAGVAAAGAAVHDYPRGLTAVTLDAQADTRIPRVDVAGSADWRLSLLDAGPPPQRWPVGYKEPPPAALLDVLVDATVRRYICEPAARFGVPRVPCARPAAAAAAAAAHAHHIAQMEETAASKALCNAFSLSLDGVYAAYLAGGGPPINAMCMIGVMIVTVAGGAQRIYLAVSGAAARDPLTQAAAVNHPGAVAAVFPAALVNWSGAAPAIPLTPAAVGSNPHGNCAAPKLLQALYAGVGGAVVLANIVSVEMTEQWHDTRPPATRRPKHGLTEPSCATCQTQVPELLCTV
ncbi:MAG: hypothetical protein ABI806_18245 [Candidatus Solibacter sp.]